MKFKSLAILGAITLSVVTFGAYAGEEFIGKNDVTITNNSDTAVTASAGNSGCSSKAGKKGVIDPGQSVVVPGFAIGMFCTNDCIVRVYTSRSCDGKIIAEATANLSEGIKEIRNANDTPGAYKVTGGGRVAFVEGHATAKKWYQIF